jgi:hypothetical protein
MPIRLLVSLTLTTMFDNAFMVPTVGAPQHAGIGSPATASTVLPRVAEQRSGRKSREEDAGGTGPANEKSPGFPGLFFIAGAGYEHLSPTLAYRFVQVIQLS